MLEMRLSVGGSLDDLRGVKVYRLMKYPWKVDNRLITGISKVSWSYLSRSSFQWKEHREGSEASPSVLNPSGISKHMSVKSSSSTLITADAVRDIRRLVLTAVRRYRISRTLSNGAFEWLGRGTHERKRCPRTIFILGPV